MDLASRVGDAASSAPLRVLLREDWETAHHAWSRPGLHALMVYRVGHWALSQPQPVRALVTFLYKIVNTFLIHNVYGAEIAAEAVIGRRVRIGHHQAIQIPPYCIIGDDCLIRHNVTIGFGGSSNDPLAVPHLGRKVKLSPGACLLGPITVGHGARIGPNCVVIANVPDGATVFIPPARVMKATVADPVSPETT